MTTIDSTLNSTQSNLLGAIDKLDEAKYLAHFMQSISLIVKHGEELTLNPYQITGLYYAMQTTIDRIEAASAFILAEMKTPKEGEQVTETDTDEASVDKENPPSDFELLRRLGDILFSLQAIHRFSYEALEMGSDDDKQMFMSYMISIAEMSRANIKGLDACMERLGGGKQGNFETEFSPG